MPSPREVRDTGAEAVGAVRRQLASKAAALLQRNPERAASAIELGIVDRAWLEEPGSVPVSPAAPLEVIQRFLERSVEQEPSLVARLGLSTLQLVAWRQPDAGDAAAAQPVCIVFTDLQGFTAFTEARGDAAAQELVTEHHRTVGPIVRSRGGRIVKRLGDGLMLSFPSPEAAVLGALDLVDDPPEPLRLRAGVHTGRAVVTPDDLIGHDVNVAARVTASVRGGKVVATSQVRDAVGELRGVTFGRARRKSYKGLAESVGVCTVMRATN
jgi:class 3 adenylate cyclase